MIFHDLAPSFASVVLPQAFFAYRIRVLVLCGPAPPHQWKLPSFDLKPLPEKEWTLPALHALGPLDGLAPPYGLCAYFLLYRGAAWERSL